MPVPPTASSTPIPDSLRRQLADFRKRLWRVKALEALAAGIIGLLLSFLVVYGMDRVVATPGWARLLVLILGASLSAVFAPWWLHRWVWKQRRHTQIARLIARHYPGLGDRLLGVIELESQNDSEETLSPRLRAAAMEAVAAEASQRSLENALPPQRHLRWSAIALLLAAITTAAFFLTPKASLNALKRWLMPLSPTERYTFAKLVSPPTTLAVPYGEAFDLTLTLAADAENRPPVASARYADQEPLHATLHSGTYAFTFPGQQTPGTVVVTIGDLRHHIRVEPHLRPAPEKTSATITPPAYTGLEPQTTELTSGNLTAVAGSSVSLAIDFTREIATAAFGPTVPTTVPDQPDAPPSPAFTPASGELTISGSLASTPASIPVGAVPFDIPLKWRDQLGLDGEPGFAIHIDSVADAPPSCYIQGIDRQLAILPEETIDFETFAEDDIGLLETGLEWSGTSTAAPTKDSQPASGSITLAQSPPSERRTNAAASFCPAAFGITPQRLTLRAFATDRFPERARSYSEPITLYILSRDEHAQLLKNRFDRHITELEDLARRELSLLDENERMERLSSEELLSENNRPKLDNQASEESESKRRFSELSERIDQLTRDAARNPTIDKNTIKKLADTLESLNELSREDIPNVESKLRDSLDPSNAPEKSTEDVKDAVASQRKAMEKIQKTIEDAREANRNFEAGTFVNRLKKAATDESAIATSIKDAFSRILGIAQASLDPADKRHLAENHHRQSNTASDVRWIQEDLRNYIARTRDESLNEVLDAMRSSGIDAALENIRSKIAENHSFAAASEATHWATQLHSWAGALDEKNKKKSGGGDGAAPDAENEDFEFMLRVMRMVQQQTDLRGRTRVLEQLRRNLGSSPTPAP